MTATASHLITPREIALPQTRPSTFAGFLTLTPQIEAVEDENRVIPRSVAEARRVFDAKSTLRKGAISVMTDAEIPKDYKPTDEELWSLLYAYRSKDVMFHLPAKTENMPHRDSILKITDTDGTFIACSQVSLIQLTKFVGKSVS